MGVQRRSGHSNAESQAPSEETPLIGSPKIEDEEGSTVVLSPFRGLAIMTFLSVVIFIQSEWSVVIWFET